MTLVKGRLEVIGGHKRSFGDLEIIRNHWDITTRYLYVISSHLEVTRGHVIPLGDHKGSFLHRKRSVWPGLALFWLGLAGLGVA